MLSCDSSRAPLMTLHEACQTNARRFIDVSSRCLTQGKARAETLPEICNQESTWFTVEICREDIGILTHIKPACLHNTSWLMVRPLSYCNNRGIALACSAYMSRGEEIILLPRMGGGGECFDLVRLQIIALQKHNTGHDLFMLTAR